MEDISLRSIQPLPEISLGSLNSSSFASDAEGFDPLPANTPINRLAASASTSSPTTAPSSVPVTTPSPPHVYTRQNKNLEATLMPIRRITSEDTEPDDSALETPVRERSNLMNIDKSRKIRTTDKAPTTLTLREQEKTIDQLNKKIWSLQLKIHYLEERLDQSQPETHQAIARQNVALKIEVHTLETELKKTKKLTLRLEKELESLGSSTSREKELERKLEEIEREIKELRKYRTTYADADQSALALQEAEDKVLDLEEHADALETELDTARQNLERHVQEVDRLRDALDHRPDNNRIIELEDAIEVLRDRLAETEDALARREDEREDLLDEVEGLRLQLEDNERRRDAEAAERSASRAELYHREEEQENMEKELNSLRDKLARTTLDLEMREEELDQKQHDIEDIEDQFKEQIDARDNEWKNEVEEARTQIEELRDILAERDAESRELKVHIAELENMEIDLQDKFETAIVHLEEATKEKETELEAANEEIQRLGDRVYELEEINEQIREEHVRWKDDALAETARLEGTVVALKEKFSKAKDEVVEVTELYEQCQAQLVAHRQRQEELAKHINDLVEELASAQEQSQAARRDHDTLVQKHEDDLRKERRAYEAKSSALQSALDELSLTTSELRRLNDDYNALQNAHRDAKALGDSQTADRFAQQLEIDRLQRDVERLENEIARVRNDLIERDQRIREKEAALDKLHVDNRELSSQLAAQTQARLNVSDKLDLTQSALKTQENDLQSLKTRLSDAESALKRAQHGKLDKQNYERDQITERNTLLLTVYQYLDKIVGVDKVAKKGTVSETKPFTNFGVFHDSIISRLKSLNSIQADFEKRCKDAESRYTERLESIRKQLDVRWRQIDKFEAGIAKVADAKASWRRKFHEKDGELENLKSAYNDVNAQLGILRRTPQVDQSGLKSMTARAVNAEKRLVNAQNQLLATEEKMLVMKDKTENAENKWEARVKEYETRIKAAEERVKRERQGAKERVAELENANKALHKQFEISQKRIDQLSTLIEASKAKT